MSVAESKSGEAEGDLFQSGACPSTVTAFSEEFATSAHLTGALPSHTAQPSRLLLLRNPHSNFAIHGRRDSFQFYSPVSANRNLAGFSVENCQVFWPLVAAVAAAAATRDINKCTVLGPRPTD